MRLQSLVIHNFRAITALELFGLGDTVVIAGPNGCGKSCVFDGIRLLKSAYGGYQPNEWQNWFGEFQINVNRRQGWQTLLQRKDRPLLVRAALSLSESEKAYLRANAKDLLAEQIWKQVAPELADWRFMGGTPLAANLRVREPEVLRRLEEELPPLLAQVEQSVHVGEITIGHDGSAATAASSLLELLFSQYDPQNLGIIDYHGANRNYGREQVGGINLNIESSEDRLRQHALYNYANKYANLKTEMAGSFVRHLLAREADGGVGEDASLSDTLKELFVTFLPGKAFLGPRPTKDGRLLFPVRLANGAEHDIDELSSGEKEVLYGYLRLRNAAPLHSVLLIDEPELHLNPRLIAGLATFYHRHLGRALDNQLWLVTHSDTLIREAVGQQGFSVFHMQPPATGEGGNQASEVGVARDVERLVVELVGDLAAYRPGAKIVVFEGGGDSEFDVRMTCTLFPQFQLAVNPLSAGNKKRVADLYSLLEEAREAGHLPARFYAITDADDEAMRPDDVPRRFQWNVYHIENYLLEEQFILRVLRDLSFATAPLDSPEGVLAALRDCAEATIPAFVAHRLRSEANRALIQCVDLGYDPERTDVGVSIAQAARRSSDRMTAAVATRLSEVQLQEKEDAIRREATGYLESGEWRGRLRGRDMLRRFVSRRLPGVRYETLRDLIVARMRDADFQPAGMKDVVDRILHDPWK